MKAKIAIFFSVLFLNLVFAPAVVSLIDENQKISLYFDIGEEEENKSEESKDLEIKIQLSENTKFLTKISIHKKQDFRFLYNNYTSNYSKVNTPPPEESV